ncbi:GNAT family N-acetyltransferase [Halobaculum limi]|uniref:GNAT family N-acetyltransferase n=1 Tax=Halobaculum limi TaxID=3031916 RepID=UPI002404D650|nr:GNAT family N-acetyltransferase [Halobaculum sp. YSMS11]
MSDAGVEIRPATAAETDAVRHLLDAAVLTVPEDLSARVAAGDCLLAVDSGRAVGTLVLDENCIDAVAVNRSRRVEGIGRQLVEAAAAQTDDPLTATFRPQVRPFYEALGFAIDPVEGDDGRFRGRLDGDPTK